MDVDESSDTFADFVKATHMVRRGSVVTLTVVP